MAKDNESPRSSFESPAALPPTVLQTPVNVRSTSLAVLALIAVMGVLLVARAAARPRSVAKSSTDVSVQAIALSQHRARRMRRGGSSALLLWVPRFVDHRRGSAGVSSSCRRLP